MGTTTHDVPESQFADEDKTKQKTPLRAISLGRTKKEGTAEGLFAVKEEHCCYSSKLEATSWIHHTMELTGARHFCSNLTARICGSRDELEPGNLIHSNLVRTTSTSALDGALLFMLYN